MGIYHAPFTSIPQSPISSPVSSCSSHSPHGADPLPAPATALTRTSNTGVNGASLAKKTVQAQTLHNSKPAGLDSGSVIFPLHF